MIAAYLQIRYMPKEQTFLRSLNGGKDAKLVRCKPDNSLVINVFFVLVNSFSL